MISFPLVNGHDDESRASTQARQATVTSLDPETLSYDNALREAHNTLLELPSTSQTHIRYSVTSFNEQLDEISADEGLFLDVFLRDISDVWRRVFVPKQSNPTDQC